MVTKKMVKFISLAMLGLLFVSSSFAHNEGQNKVKKDTDALYKKENDTKKVRM